MPNRCSGAAFDSPHRITTKDTSVTTELSRPTRCSSVALDELLDVFGDALVRVVGRVALSCMR